MHAVYISSKGGQDRYVCEVDAASAADALDKFCADNGVHGLRQLVGCQERMQTTGVLYYYTYADAPAEVVI